MAWETVVEKFERLSSGRADAGFRRQIVQAVDQLDSIQAADLAQLLERVAKNRTQAAALEEPRVNSSIPYGEEIDHDSGC